MTAAAVAAVADLSAAQRGWIDTGAATDHTAAAAVAVGCGTAGAAVVGSVVQTVAVCSVPAPWNLGYQGQCHPQTLWIAPASQQAEAVRAGPAAAPLGRFAVLRAVALGPVAAVGQIEPLGQNAFQPLAVQAAGSGAEGLPHALNPAPAGPRAVAVAALATRALTLALAFGHCRMAPP